MAINYESILCLSLSQFAILCMEMTFHLNVVCHIAVSNVVRILIADVPPPHNVNKFARHYWKTHNLCPRIEWNHIGMWSKLQPEHTLLWFSV